MYNVQIVHHEIPAEHLIYSYTPLQGLLLETHEKIFSFRNDLFFLK